MKTFRLSVGWFEKYGHICEMALPLEGGITRKDCFTSCSSSKLKT